MTGKSTLIVAACCFRLQAGPSRSARANVRRRSSELRCAGAGAARTWRLPDRGRRPSGEQGIHDRRTPTPSSRRRSAAFHHRLTARGTAVHAQHWARRSDLPTSPRSFFWSTRAAGFTRQSERHSFHQPRGLGIPRLVFAINKMDLVSTAGSASTASPPRGSPPSPARPSTRITRPGVPPAAVRAPSRRSSYIPILGSERRHVVRADAPADGRGKMRAPLACWSCSYQVRVRPLPTTRFRPPARFPRFQLVVRPANCPNATRKPTTATPRPARGAARLRRGPMRSPVLPGGASHADRRDRPT